MPGGRRLRSNNSFGDYAYWNDYVRKPHEAPIDPDPDGALTSALAYVNGILSGEVYVAPERA